MTVVPGTSQNGLISIDEVLKNTATEDIVLQAGAKYLIDNNIRVFNHSILTISKFSDQLHLEPSADGLSLKALNSSKSAFASILFTRHFFSDCDVSKIDATANNLCRISMRSALAIFGRVGTDRAQLSCRLQVDPRADYLIAQMSYKHFVTKCFVVPFRDCVVTYKHLFNDKSKLRNRLTLQARILLAVLTQIGTDLDEVKIIATSESFSIERFFTTDDDRARVRKSDAHIDLDVFDRYLLQHSSEVAVNLKELKAVLAFADATGMPVNLHFDQPGRPIIVAVEENAEFVAEFVLATFEGPQTNFYKEAAVVEPAGAEIAQPRAVGSQNAACVEEMVNFGQPDGRQLELDPIPESFQLRANVDVVQPADDGAGGDHVKPGNHDKLLPHVADGMASDAENFVNDLPPKNNRFDELDDEILAEPPPEPLPIDQDKSADNDLLLAEMQRLDTAGRTLTGEVVGDGEHHDYEKECGNSGTAEVVKRSSVDAPNTFSGKEIARVVVDEDCGFDLNSWTAKQAHLHETVDLASDALNAAGPSTAELVSGFISEPSEAPPLSSRFNDAPPASQFYDCINLSCSPSAYLDGERPFNIRLAESQLERLHQINREMPSQSQVDDGMSDSFVGRMLDAAVEKTKPTNSSSTPVLMTTEVVAKTENRTGNFAPTGHAFDASQSMIEEPFLQNVSHDSMKMNLVESAVELLQSRFGGFKRRPSTQHFSQEQVDLVGCLNIFDFARGSATPGRQRDNVTTDIATSLSDRFTPPQRLCEQPTTRLKNNTSIAAIVQKDRKRNLHAFARSTVAMSRPLAEIDRDLHSDNPLLIDESIVAPDAHDVSDEVIVVADSVRPVMSVQPSAHRAKPLIGRFGMESESNNLSASIRSFREVVSAKAVAPKAPAIKNVRRTANFGESNSELSTTDERRQKRSDVAASPAAAVTSSTSSVLLLEEDYGCEGGWLRKPNTQRSQVGGTAAALSKSTQTVRRQAGHAKRIDSTDEELERILISVNNYSDERRRASYRTAIGMSKGPDVANETEQRRKRLSTGDAPSSSAAIASLRTASVARPLRKKPTLADELARRPSSRIEPPAVVVLTSPKKRRA